jgi:hypothetical protein
MPSSAHIAPEVFVPVASKIRMWTDRVCEDPLCQFEPLSNKSTQTIDNEIAYIIAKLAPIRVRRTTGGFKPPAQIPSQHIKLKSMTCMEKEYAARDFGRMYELTVNRRDGTDRSNPTA